MCRRCVSLLFSGLLFGGLTGGAAAEEPLSVAAPQVSEPTAQVAAPADSPPPPVSSGGQPLPLPPGESVGNLTLRETTARGIWLFQQGDYDGAIQSFTAAYVLSPKPMFLFNIAQAHRKAGRPREALIQYQLFLRKLPDTPLRAETEAYIELVRTQLAVPQAPQPGPAPTPSPQPPISPPPAQARVATPLYKRPWLWGTLGAVVAVGTGVAVGVYLGTRPPSTTLGIIEPTF